MNLRMTFGGAVVISAVLLASSQYSLTAAVMPQHDHAAPQATPDEPSPATRGMMKMHEQMMARMKGDDGKLEALLEKVNTATGEARTAALVALVNELVRQQKATHAHMVDMHQQMMNGRGMMKGRQP